MKPATNTSIVRLNGDNAVNENDWVATEEPLEIRLKFHTPSGITVKSISVTMRTPGQDKELAIGFLYTEGIIHAATDVIDAAFADAKDKNVIIVSLQPHCRADISKLERNFYTTSSCGVCGKSSIEAVRTTCNILDTKDNITISPTLLYSLPDKLRSQQSVFESTGGLHACAIFSLEGELLALHEDAGRHNALDKLIGSSLLNDKLPLNEHILLLSGRTSFELVQKAVMAGIKIITSVGAPSSLAVQMADEWGITLVGFLRNERCNIYTGAQRINVNL
jgi:FdhD protein